MKKIIDNWSKFKESPTQPLAEITQPVADYVYQNTTIPAHSRLIIPMSRTSELRQEFENRLRLLGIVWDEEKDTVAYEIQTDYGPKIREMAAGRYFQKMEDLYGKMISLTRERGDKEQIKKASQYLAKMGINSNDINYDVDFKSKMNKYNKFLSDGVDSHDMHAEVAEQLNLLKQNYQAAPISYLHEQVRSEDAKTSGQKDSYVLFSSHPIDVVRMSDVGLTSCHAPNQDYFKHAVEASLRDEKIAYQLSQEHVDRLLKFFGVTTLEELNQNKNFWTEEIFSDQCRPIKAPISHPIARMRIRPLTAESDEDIEMTDKENLLFVPIYKTYGVQTKSFTHAVNNFLYQRQKDKIKELRKAAQEDVIRFEYTGGEYEDVGYDGQQNIRDFLMFAGWNQELGNVSIDAASDYRGSDYEDVVFDPASVTERLENWASDYGLECYVAVSTGEIHLEITFTFEPLSADEYFLPGLEGEDGDESLEDWAFRDALESTIQEIWKKEMYPTLALEYPEILKYVAFSVYSEGEKYVVEIDIAINDPNQAPMNYVGMGVGIIRLISKVDVESYVEKMIKYNNLFEWDVIHFIYIFFDEIVDIFNNQLGLEFSDETWTDLVDSVAALLIQSVKDTFPDLRYLGIEGEEKASVDDEDKMSLVIERWEDYINTAMSTRSQNRSYLRLLFWAPTYNIANAKSMVWDKYKQLVKENLPQFVDKCVQDLESDSKKEIANKLTKIFQEKMRYKLT